MHDKTFLIPSALQAERAVEEYFQQKCDLVVFGLIASLRHATNYTVRMLSAILLRRRLPNGENDMMSQLPDDLQVTVKEEVAPPASLCHMWCDLGYYPCSCLRVAMRRSAAAAAQVRVNKLYCAHVLSHILIPRAQLLAAVLTEPKREVRRLVVDAVAAVAEVLLYKNAW
jgi:hypothetical protein